MPKGKNLEVQSRKKEVGRMRQKGCKLITKAEEKKIASDIGKRMEAFSKRTLGKRK